MGESDTLSQSEIDALLNSLTSGGGSGPKKTEKKQQEAVSVAPADNYIDNMPVEEDKKGYKLYNFRRPDKFSKDHLRALQDIHKEFSRQLSLILTTYLRMSMEVDVISVDQLTYDEFARSMPSPITIGIIELSPLPGQILLGMNHEVTSSIVDRMLGGTGLAEAKPRELTDIEEALAKRIVIKLAHSLEEAWKTVFPIKALVVGIDNNYSMIQIASPGEIVALITFEVQILGRYSGLLSLCFPYPVLENLLSQLSTQHIFQTKGIITTSEEKQRILDKLNKTNVRINVLLGNVDISVHELLDLKVGDVLRLDCLVNDDLTVTVNEIPKFLARPGIKKNKIAVNVSGLITDNDDNN